ncbi:MAG: alanine--glyoxylate aminotransferase family protein [Candidatus Tectomicrobia bacterium]|nr:alanine--glyoxylate aminotransferase family protein [Candidatus Tectomicrobia bacterium]
MVKNYLLTPGPTPLAPEVVAAMAQPILYHRAKEFEHLFEQIRIDLRYLYETAGDVLLFTSSGTGAMEAAVCNVLSPDQKALVVRGGKFGERWAELCQAYHVKLECIDVEWGESVEPAQVQRHLEQDTEIRAVFVQASETSTGVAHDVQAIGEIVRKFPQTLLVVDAITAMGVSELRTDAWGLDIVVSGSQKGLMLPPGLAFASVSEKAWSFVERAQLPRYYFDFRAEQAAQRKLQNAFTPAISLIMGLAVALQLIRREGLEHVIARHARLARMTRAAVRALGLELLAKRAPSAAVTAVWNPPGVEGKAIVRGLHDRFGITIAGGQGKLSGKIFRLAHLGYVEAGDILMGIAALETVLAQLGVAVTPGSGVAAAEAEFTRNDG